MLLTPPVPLVAAQDLGLLGVLSVKKLQSLTLATISPCVMSVNEKCESR